MQQSAREFLWFQCPIQPYCPKFPGAGHRLTFLFQIFRVQHFQETMRDKQAPDFSHTLTAPANDSAKPSCVTSFLRFRLSRFRNFRRFEAADTQELNGRVFGCGKNSTSARCNTNIQAEY